MNGMLGVAVHPLATTLGSPTRAPSQELGPAITLLWMVAKTVLAETGSQEVATCQDVVSFTSCSLIKHLNSVISAPWDPKTG